MEFKQLETDALIIRTLSNADVQTIFRLSREKSLGEWIPDQVYADEQEAAGVIDFLKSQYEPSPDPAIRPFVLGIALKETGELIGHVGLSPLTDGEIEIGYAVGEDHVGRGYATQAVEAMSRWALIQQGIPKINGIVACENVGSGRVLEKAGYNLDSESDHYYLGKVRPCRKYSFTQSGRA